MSDAIAALLHAAGPGAYPHKVEFNTAAELKDLKLGGRGWHVSFEWATEYPRTAWFSEGMMHLASVTLDMLALRDCMAARISGLLDASPGRRPEPTPAFVEELKNFDFVVRATEQLIAAHGLLEKPVEVGTFGVRRPVTPHSVLAERIFLGENSKFMTTGRIYERLREAYAQ